MVARVLGHSSSRSKR